MENVKVQTKREWVGGTQTEDQMHSMPLEDLRLYVDWHYHRPPTSGHILAVAILQARVAIQHALKKALK